MERMGSDMTAEVEANGKVLVELVSDLCVTELIFG
jgi:hypothetical protein